MGISTHPDEAKAFNKQSERVTWHDKTLWFVREKRDKSVHQLPEWETLRELAAQIKAHTLSHLDDYLLQFEKQAKKNGIKVHWAKDAEDHNQIVKDILIKHEAKKVVKSKSMLTEECGLNPYLSNEGIEVIDTDLGERIVQLAKEKPSHIVLPAIHKKKEEVGELFHQHLQTDKGATDPTYLTEAARQHLREQFLTADAAITGVNFAVAETGGFVVCTNEGNVDMGANLAKVHIASMGIEKIIPLKKHLGIFLRLLARSATGQPITTYSSHFHKPKKGKELHIILVDNGRTKQLSKPDFRSSLNCIRCGACMNTCPVYRRSGGHSYNYSIPGPIGAILSPGKDLNKYSSLPFASTLCGSCTDVCPVKIDIHTQLYKWRQIIGDKGHLPPSKKWSMKITGKVMGHPKTFHIVSLLGTTLLKSPKMILNNPFNTWGKDRDLPQPKHTFSHWYKKQNKHEEQ
ncbi:iron-sulfur cluster-binding protein [Flammeovirga yaeyamensis]|uniref:Iron-sulfur cluster-binding protein n=1 Tax=Flammeovirga yaeyamensis TaxID=367791 RepID=A0AAX1ND60_9BACT|nr:LutB/LldF family L-lactate oxidation iron-sulfur protein [Flammeovirga yaeyamensis]MBB3697198.1 L-lactate dehydrogenase complex protein LldF [Flammeovirga yaeyamensis]NMF33858.1 iron-sulfur cluster-binding protein [Flammeovirga yaeyamensis]QWG04881.1 iron-sulfur cluster-binding protein [Flammeovirga yaeyamensis]